MTADRPRVYTGFDQYSGGWGQPQKPTVRQRMEGKPVVTYGLLGTILVVFLAELLVSNLDERNGTHWFEALFVIAPDWPWRPWSLVTSTLSHSPDFILHIVANGVALFFFGPTMEKLMGPGRYLVLFFVAGAVSGVIQVAITGGAALGASGAIMMLIGAAIIVMPNAQVFIFPIPVPIKLWMVGIGFAALDVLGAFAGNTPFGHFAHLSGMAIGLVMGQRLKEELRRKGLRLRYG